jgi:uncharacterized protein (TIGR02284 family)
MLQLVYAASAAGGVYVMEPTKSFRATAEGHDALRRLIEINKDAQAWFHLAAIDSFEKPDLLALYEGLSEQRRVFVRELEDALVELSGKLRRSGTRLLARGWFDIRFQTRNHRERLDRSLALEDRFTEEYQRALALEWPAHIKGLLNKHTEAARDGRRRLLELTGD